MSKTKEEMLYSFVSDKLKPNRSKEHKELVQNWADMLEVRYNMPQQLSYPALTAQKSPDQMSRKELFWILSVIDETEHAKNTERFFTKQECLSYSISSMLSSKISFPIEFDVIEITEDQWIGRITAKELVRLRDAGLIYYNPEAQRPFLRVVHGQETYVKINSNQSAIKAIDDSFMDGSRIPDTITLNIPEVSETEYIDGKLIISDLEHFELVDGYHRFVALNRNTNRNPDFDYPMEIRFTKFALDKERQFINQEDKKVPMKKTDAAAYDQTSIGNQIVNKLKEKQDIRQLLQSSVVINEGMLGIFLDVYYELTKETSRKEIVEIRDLFYEQISATYDYNPDIINTKMSYNETFVFAYLWSIKYNPKNIIKREKEIEKIIFSDGLNKTRTKNYYSKVVEKLKKGGFDNV